MRRLSPHVVVLIVALLAHPTRAQIAGKSHPAWMVGKWGRVDGAARVDPDDCPEAEYYGRNGYVTYPEGGGVDRWWIAKDELVRRSIVPMAGDRRSGVGRMVRQRFTRTRSGALVFRGDGWTQRLVRCGDVPPGWTYRPGK